MKKHYRCPAKKDIVVNSIVEIYGDYINRKDYQGRAKIIERLECGTPLSQRPFIVAEVGNPKKQAPHTIIWSWKRWKILFIDGPNKGWITARKIAYFVAINNYYESKDT